MKILILMIYFPILGFGGGFGQQQQQQSGGFGNFGNFGQGGFGQQQSGGFGQNRGQKELKQEPEVIKLLWTIFITHLL
eukprot:UN08621